MATKAPVDGGGRERRSARGDPTFRRLLVAVGVAVLLHPVLLVPIGYLLPDAPGASEPGRSVSIDFYARSLRSLAPLFYHPAEPIPEGQVVDAPEVTGASGEASPDARFLSERAQTVAEESQAHIRIAGPHRVGSTISGPGSARAGRRLPGQVGAVATGAGAGRDPAPNGPDIVRAPPGAAAPAGAPGAPAESGGASRAARAALPSARSPLTAGAGVSPLPPGDPLVPGFEELSAAVAGSGIDRLDGVASGDETAVSTRPFAHAGFFRRVKDRVAQYWDVRGAFAYNDPLGTVYGYRDRETIVLVTLDCSGNLDGSILLEDSGARFLDELAVDSIAQAAPFHNPPQELCDADRDIITFTFGFYVEADQGPSLQVRYGRQ
ncbi:MAG: energy transducer TonB [Deltaproteobacteria bacterium]|nr:energy transducer TonB [Deltaproteobacteria bacterium]